MTDKRSPFGGLDPEDAAALATGEKWPEEMERPRGILNDADRQYLYGVKEYDTRQSEYERRKGIRERVSNGLLDIQILTLLDAEQQERVVQQVGDGELRESFADFVAFLYLQLDTGETGIGEWLEEAVSLGVTKGYDQKRAEGEYYGHPHVEVDIDVEDAYNVDEIEDRLEEGYGHTLTPAEIGILVREGRVDVDELEQLDNTPDPDNPLFSAPSVEERDED